MPKGSFTSNVFEQLEDLAKSTTKSAAQAVAKPVNPVNIFNEILNPGGKPSADEKNAEKLKEEQQKKGNSTPLDLEKLSKTYQNNDALKLQAFRRQFESVKQSESKAIEERKKEEQERINKFEREEQEKKRQEEQKRMQEQEAPAPQGKQRKSIMGAKKKAQQQHQETKPSVGKQ